MPFSSQALTGRAISSSYLNVLQKYIPAGTSSYILDASGNIVFSFLSESLGRQLVTSEQVSINFSSSWASSSLSSSYTITSSYISSSINVKQYGALGDGTTNDTNAFQSAFNNSQTVYIPSGSYVIGNLSTKNRQFVYGEGRNTRLIFLTGSSGYMFNCISGSAQLRNLELYGLSDNSRPSSSGSRSAIHISASYDSTRLENLVIHGFNNNGITMEGESNTRGDAPSISNCSVYYCYKGIETSTIALSGAEYTKITNTNLHNNGVGIDIGSGNTIVHGCTINDNTDNVWLTNTGDNEGHGTVVGCMINHASVYSVKIQSVRYGFTFVGNQIFYGNLLISGSKGINFTGNTLALQEISASNNTGLNKMSDNWFYINSPTDAALSRSLSHNLYLIDNWRSDSLVISSSVNDGYFATSVDTVYLSASAGAAIGGVDSGVIASTTTQVGIDIPRRNKTTDTVQVGYQVGFNSTTASNAVQIGFQTGFNSTTASNAVQIGFGAGFNAPNVANAVQIGFQAGQNTKTGSNAVQIGFDAGINSTNADQTVQIGAGAGQNTTNASNAVQIGFDVGFSSTTANQSVQIGFGVGFNSTTASNATQIGYQAGQNSTNASNAVQIGSNAGFASVNSSASVQIGASAGANASTGSFSVFIGSFSDPLTPSVSVTKSVAIGYNAKVAGNNMCVLGGTGDDALNVGIGTNSPVSRLHVSGTVSASRVDAMALIIPTGLTTSTAVLATGSMFLSSSNFLFIYNGTSWRSSSFS